MDRCHSKGLFSISHQNKCNKVKPYFVSNDILEMGVSNIDINGISLKIYDKERCICDCFRYRSKMDSEMFSKAIVAYASDEYKDISRLYEYAKQLKIVTKVNDVMEVVLNGV